MKYSLFYLQDQLLSNVVMKERPHLETQRDNLLESIARDLGMLREFEDRVLSLLQAIYFIYLLQGS